MREVRAGARPNLSNREAQTIEELIGDYQDIFETKSGDHGRTEKVYHRIDAGDARSIRQSPRRTPLAKQAEVNDMLENMKRKGVIEESDSPWSSPVVLVRKKDGNLHYCGDYRRLNDVTKRDCFPLPDQRRHMPDSAASRGKDDGCPPGQIGAIPGATRVE
jgi:hypothetical protein